MEMAYQRKDLIGQIRNLQHEIKTHLVKVFVFEQHTDQKHWQTELDGWLSRIDEMFLKPSKRKLSGDTYYQLLFVEPLGGGIHELNQSLKHLRKKGFDVDSVTAEQRLLAYQNIETVVRQIAFDIANNKFEDFGSYLV